MVWDVFVSYRHQDPDGPWVREVLVERLREAGLAVFVDVDSFRLGMPLVLEMARGVEQCRPLSPPEVLERLNARLSRSAVAVADVEYPEAFTITEDEAPSPHGTLIVAKALLTPDMPYELLTYALKETAFPRQSTGDQFFDHAQFDAYRALGSHIGTAGKPPPS